MSCGIKLSQNIQAITNSLSAVESGVLDGPDAEEVIKVLVLSSPMS
jgi:hypothetical protein